MAGKGSANTAVGEVFGTFLLPDMMARAVRGRQSPADLLLERFITGFTMGAVKG